nr:hypothetical protein [Angustibacter aerolatus]
MWDGEGRPLLDLSSQAGEHQRRAPAPGRRARHPGAGRATVHHRAAARRRRPQRGRAAGHGARAGRAEQGVLHQRRRRGDRERGADGAAAHRAPQGAQPVPQYHGNTQTAIHLTGDPRRWPNDSGAEGIVHFFGPYLYRSAFHAQTEEEECARALEHLEQVIQARGPGDHRGARARDRARHRGDHGAAARVPRRRPRACATGTASCGSPTR